MRALGPALLIVALGLGQAPAALAAPWNRKVERSGTPKKRHVEPALEAARRLGLALPGARSEYRKLIKDVRSGGKLSAFSLAMAVSFFSSGNHLLTKQTAGLRDVNTWSAVANYLAAAVMATTAVVRKVKGQRGARRVFLEQVIDDPLLRLMLPKEVLEQEGLRLAGKIDKARSMGKETTWHDGWTGDFKQRLATIEGLLERASELQRLQRALQQPASAEELGRTVRSLIEQSKAIDREALRALGESEGSNGDYVVRDAARRGHEKVLERIAKLELKIFDENGALAEQPDPVIAQRDLPGSAMQFQRSVLRGHLFPRERRGMVHVFSRAAMLPLLVIAGAMADSAMGHHLLAWLGVSADQAKDYPVFMGLGALASVWLQDWAARVGWQVDGTPAQGRHAALFRWLTSATALRTERLIDGGNNALRNLWRQTQGLPQRSLEQFLQEKVEADTLDLLP